MIEDFPIKALVILCAVAAICAAAAWISAEQELWRVRRHLRRTEEELAAALRRQR